MDPLKNNFCLDRCIGFIANRLVRVFQKAFDEKLAELELTSAQFSVLCKLFEEEGLTQTELASRLYVETPTLVRTLDRLESADFIERRRDPEDRRAHLVLLRPKSRKIEKRMLQIGLDVQQEVTEGLSDEEVENLRDHLLR
ncbi:MAG TPA: MarR family transcriptional regulator, partial [Thermodesulfobacteriaceae bacterium]|nr:MarR family transcriptional regulator [Thermodesulfobacteriaceae bacterium]